MALINIGRDIEEQDRIVIREFWSGNHDTKTIKEFRDMIKAMFAGEEEASQQDDSADLCERCGYPKDTHPRTTCWGEEPNING